MSGGEADDAVWRKLYNLVQKADGASVNVGVPPGELAEIGLIHEFGAPGANIPERSFIRSTMRKKRPQLIAMQARLAAMILAGKITPAQAMEMLGANVAYAIKETIHAGDFAPLAPSTVKAKGSSEPLVETGSLVDAITWTVKT